MRERDADFQGCLPISILSSRQPLRFFRYYAVYASLFSPPLTLRTLLIGDVYELAAAMRYTRHNT